MLVGTTLFTAVALQSQPNPAPAAVPGVSEKAMELHRRAILVDTHVDTTMKLMQPGWDFSQRHPASRRGVRDRNASHTDLPRMKEGGLDAPFFSIYMSGTVTGPAAVKRSLEQIDAVRQLTLRYPDEMMPATTAAQVRAAHQQGKIAVLMGMEGGHMIADSLPVLRNYAALGIRYLTLTHGEHTNWADSSSKPPVHNGLTDFGRDVVRELNRLGVMVDVSHVSDQTFWDALEVSQAPMIASHSSARALASHTRNMTDDMIKGLASKGGVIQITFVDSFISQPLVEADAKLRPLQEAIRAELEEKYPGAENAERRADAFWEEYMKRRQELKLPVASWELIVDHIHHVARLVGWQHVGIGSDFDGATMPEGMEDATQLPRITQALLDRGYSEEQVLGVLGGNLLRVMEQVEKTAQQMK